MFPDCAPAPVELPPAPPPDGNDDEPEDDDVPDPPFPGDRRLPVIVFIFDTHVLTCRTELREIFSSLGAIKSGVRSADDWAAEFDWPDDDDDASQKGVGFNGLPELIGLLELSYIE